MKTRILLLVAISSIITLSFTVSAVNKREKPPVIHKEANVDQGAPAGGFVSEDKF